MMKYAEVAVDAPTGYDRTFTYSIPSSMSLSPGHMVQVPFGPRVLPGIVFQLTLEPQVTETRDVVGIVHPEPVLSPHQLALARWVSNYYMAPLFDCSALMTPPGLRIRSRVYLTLAQAPSEAKLTPAQDKAVAYIAARGRTERGAVLKALGPSIDAALNSLLRQGVIEASWEWQKPRIGPKYATFLEVAVPPPEALEMSAQMDARAPRQAALLRDMAQWGTTLLLASAQKQFGASAVKGLEEKDLVRRTHLRLDRDPLRDRTFLPDSPLILTEDQRRSVESIQRAMESASSAVFLLQGVTGSGKTEVYLRALAHALSMGKRGIVMVPELSLTPQTIERFGRRLPGQVAVLHSGLSQGEHFDQWWRIQEGGYGVVIGSRGSIFAPQPDLGLIVIDEEHEWTYKQQDSSPRYHAREVALKLAELTGALVILGSATPDVVSYDQALSGRYRLLELPHRIVSTPGGGTSTNAPLSPVHVVDLRMELKEGNRSIFSRALSTALEQTLQAGEQAMLYLNRRGSGSLVQCRDCGHTVRCRRCDLPLTYHAQGERLLCHHCNYRLVPPRLCSQCRSPRVRYLGLGTQRVVEEVQHAFPSVKVLRWDRDAASARGAHEKTMELFHRGEAQVLVGTQMIAKGLHFPNVTLIGVLCADIGLFLPDFRSGERAFQLLCQVAGRTGRGPLGGQVIIQTYSPHHYAVAAAAAQDYKSFYRSESTYRQEQELPPYGRLIHLGYTHTNQSLCQKEALRWGGALRRQRDAWGLTNVDILGPAPAYPPRLRGRYRWHIILRGQDPRSLLDKTPIPQGWTVDVDPASVA